MATTTTNPVLDAALAYRKSGRSVIYIEPGFKYPKQQGWKQYQAAAATPEEIRAWFEAHNRGLAIITGTVSGGGREFWPFVWTGTSVAG